MPRPIPNIGVPRVYAEHALACKDEGYIAYKIHPHYFWNPATRQPTPGRPSNIKADIETIHLVREAVGPDYVLMYDPWGTYMTLEEAIKVGRELEKLDYYWYEHPMPEYRVESYVRLGRELTIPILSPEIVAGGVFSRAEWILRGAGDMSRIDVVRGGITGARKTAIVCEAYGLRCEMHMAGWGNLQVLRRDLGGHLRVLREGPAGAGRRLRRAASVPQRAPATGSTPTATSTCRKGPGMGYEIVWDYIDDNLIDPDGLGTRSSGRARAPCACRASGDRSRSLDLLARKGPLGVRAVAQQLGLPLGSVHRLLLDLAEEDVVERDRGRRVGAVVPAARDHRPAARAARVAAARPAVRRKDRGGDAGDGQHQRAQRPWPASASTRCAATRACSSTCAIGSRGAAPLRRSGQGDARLSCAEDQEAQVLGVPARGD